MTTMTEEKLAKPESMDYAQSCDSGWSFTFPDERYLLITDEGGLGDPMENDYMLCIYVNEESFIEGDQPLLDVSFENQKQCLTHVMKAFGLI